MNKQASDGRDNTKLCWMAAWMRVLSKDGIEDTKLRWEGLMKSQKAAAWIMPLLDGSIVVSVTGRQHGHSRASLARMNGGTGKRRHE